MEPLLVRRPEVHFANESLDLHSRGGRLSADIQAVAAADYIRNLREVTKKDPYGRLKQGFYAPSGSIGSIVIPRTVDSYYSAPPSVPPNCVWIGGLLEGPLPTDEGPAERPAVQVREAGICQ